jgi:transcription elongation GreA/GreB family factor
MSKAFTKESDDVPEPAARRRGIPVPELNLVTPAGLVAARAELDQLARTGGDPERVRELADHLATAQAAPPPEDRAAVGLGARVTVEDARGEQHVYAIVGAIEQDPRRGRISWQSPLAQALWGLRAGDNVQLPRGEAEVVAVEYD